MTEPHESPQTDETVAPNDSSEAQANVTDHTEAAENEQPYFPNEVWQHLLAQDRAAAKAIVVLLTGLFVVGLILYGIIAVVVS